MAARHQLALDVIPTAQPTILKLSDASIYSALMPVECPRLEIYLPGFLTPTYVSENLPVGFVRLLSAQDLGVQPMRDETPRALPDGIYRVGYAVAPHEYSQVDYYHLRTTQIENALAQELCRVQLQACELSTDQLQHLNALRRIQLYVQAARAQAEHCHAPVRGQELLTYAESQLKKLRAHACPTC